MDSQIILAVNDKGVFLEYIQKAKGHQGEGKRHLAIVVLLLNSRNEVLLQKRKHKIFDNIWDLTGATHPLHRKDGSDESLEEATWRCLEEELGIKEKMALQNLGFFNYFAKYGPYCENEYCAMMIGRYDGEIKLNTDSVYSYKWVNRKNFLKDIKQKPEAYSPWANEGVKRLSKEVWNEK